MSVIPLSFPDVTDAEINAVVGALRSGRLSQGPRQARFEEMVAERAGRRHGVAVSSGTAGLHLALLALGVGPGDEVITTPFSFIASANAILYVGAKPVFVDIDARSLNMSADKVEAAITPKTKAILAVEVFGTCSPIERLASIAQRHEIPLIEDACESLGALHQGKPAGSFGRVGVFGFYTNKPVVTGEGGMIVTDDDRLAALCRSLRNHGRDDTGSTQHSSQGHLTGATLSHPRLGYNYRMNELSAALGLAQMERLDDMLGARRRVASTYMRRLMGIEDILLPNVDDPDHASWFAFVVRLSDQYTANERDRVIEGMRRHEVGASNYFPCIHLQPFYRERFGHKPGDFPVAESIASRVIALPFFNKLDDTAIELVAQTLRVMIQREQLLKR